MSDEPETPTRRIVLLQSLGAAPAQVAQAAAALPPEAHAWRPAPGEWSAHNVLAHLAAAEPPFLQRLIRVRDEANPFLPYFGPDVAKPESADPLPQIVDRFRDARAGLLAFLASLPLEAWERPAVHETLGPTTLTQQVQNIVRHDAEHLGNLRHLWQAWEAHRRG